MTNDMKKEKSGKKSAVRRRKRFHKILVPKFAEAPSNKIKVLLVDAKPGRLVGPSSDVGRVKLQTRSRSILELIDSPYDRIYSEHYGEIKQIYLKKGATVYGGEPFALLELFDASEFNRRAEEYEAALEVNDEMSLIEYPKNLKGASPEILRRAAKLMTGIYRHWNSDEDFYPAAESIDSDFPIDLEEENLNENYYFDEFTGEESSKSSNGNWEVERKFLFDLVSIDEIEVWFEDDHLSFADFEHKFESARLLGPSREDPYRYSNILRWVYIAERIISEESELGDERVREIYEVIELQKGVENRSSDS